MEKLLKIFAAFDIDGDPISISPLGNGLINNTYLALTDKEKYVMQKINTAVFTDPVGVMDNIFAVTEHIKKRGGVTLDFVKTKDGGFYSDTEEGFFRLYKFMDNSKSYDVIDAPLFEKGAEEFGKFQYYLSDFDASLAKETIKDFHNTAARVDRFRRRLTIDEFSRAAECEHLTKRLLELAPLGEAIVKALENGEIPTRVVHNDTKISNVLFTNDGNGLCVIDLDTVMPGSLLYDFGDAIRSGAANEPEWSADFEKVYVREDLYEAFVKGYLKGTNGALTEKEFELLPLSAFICTYELSVRFLDDYLDGGRYFRPKDQKLNLIRAENQLILAEDILSKLDTLKKITEKYKNN